MKILYTSALINDYYEDRKIEYIKSYNKLLEKFNKNDIYIIECFNDNGLYLNDLNTVFLTNTHNEKLKNKGVKEALGLKKFIENINISDDEFIIKLTGRYFFINFDIFNYINNNYDCYIKYDSYQQVFFGCLICKFKIFKNFIYNLNLEYMEKHMINIEKEFANYIINNKINYFELYKLNIYSKINNTDIVYW